MAGRRRLGFTIAGALAAVLVAAYLITSRVQPVPVAPIAPVETAAARSSVDERAPLVDSGASERSSIEPLPAPSATTPAPGAATPAFAGVSGIVRFADGTVPEPLRIALDFQGARVRSRSDDACRARTSAATDVKGRFEIGNPCAGTHRASSPSFAGDTVEFEQLVTAPSRDVELVIRGHVLYVDVVDAERRPIRGAVIEAVARRDPSVAQPESETLRIRPVSDEHGRAAIALAGPGEVTVGAFQGVLVCEPVVVPMRGASSSRVELVLAPPQVRPTLRIAVTACAPAGEPVRAYCLTFHDVAAGHRRFRVCSEDVGADGTIDTIRPGTYTVRAVPRFVGEPITYRDQTKEPGTRLVVEDGRINELALCVRIGGRIALEVRERAPADGEKTPPVLVLRVDERDGTARPFDLREPDATGVTISHYTAFGVERASEAVLDEGEYVLRLAAKGYVDQDVRVFVRAGETTRVLALLDRTR